MSPGLGFGADATTNSPGLIAKYFRPSPVEQRLVSRSRLEILERHRARAVGPGQIDLAAIEQERGREIARSQGGEAHAFALRRHVLHVRRAR